MRRLHAPWLVLLLGALAPAALAQSALPAPGTVQAWLGRTARPGGGESLDVALYGATGLEVAEFRLWGRALEEALRPGYLELDPAQLRVARSWRFPSAQGQLPLPSLPGVYVYVTRGATAWDPAAVTAQAVVVSDLHLGVKRDDGRSVALAHLAGQPASWAQLDVLRHDEQGGPPAALQGEQLNAWGLGSFPTPRAGTLIYLARVGRHVAITEAWDRGAASGQPAWLAHVQTDRPLYRPGHTVHLKAILREALPGGGHRTPRDEPVRFVLVQPDGSRTPLAGEPRTTRFGTASADYVLPEAAALGEWQLELEAGPAPGQPFASQVVGRTSFGVEAFRKPEFQVTVTPRQPRALQGREVEAEVAADYFFGAPVPDAEVQWTISRQPRWRWWNPWIRPMLVRFCLPPFQPEAQVAQGTTRLDARGRATVRFTPERLDADADYVVRARVRDASDREVAGSGTVLVARAAFDLILTSDRQVYAPGDLVDVRLSLAGGDGAAVAGVSCELTAERIDPQGQRELRLRRTLVSGPDGSARLTLRAANQASYELTAVARDADGNEVRASRTIWVADGRGGVDYSHAQVEVVADREVYQVGDTARLLIRAPLAGGVGLLTVESDAMHRRLGFVIRGGLALVELPIEASYAPNAFVSVLVPGRDGVVTGQLELNVPPVDGLIEVTVEADRPHYRPGEVAQLRLRTVDAAGRPVAAEVALGAVDEALFALREDATPALVDTFYPRRWDAVTTAGAQGGWGFPGGPMFKLAAAGGPQAAAKAPGEERPREDFPDTLAWLAHVTTDAQGEARLSLPVADSLTTWRLTARAVSEDTRLGETRTRTLVRKDLLVRLATPRALVEGDRLTLVGVVHNLAPEGTPGAEPARVAVRLQAQGLRVVGAAAQAVSVPREGLARVSWEVEVVAPGEAQLEVSAEAGFERDALRVRLPVAARGVAQPVSRSGALLQDGTLSFTLDKDPRAIDAACELVVELSPSLAGTLLDSLDTLTGFPYGCIEQTMSRFLPDVVVAEALRASGRPDAALQAALPEMVKVGVDRIAGMQNPDGGFGWFAQNQSHPYVSAYVTYGLALARRNGFAVPDALLDGATGFLVRSLEGGAFDADGQAYALYALTTAGLVRQSDLIAVAARRGELNAYTRAALILALVEAGQRSLASDLAADLAREALSQGGKTHWEGSSLSYGRWTGNRIEATAYAARALLAVDPAHPLLSQAVAWLLERRQAGGNYVTTKDTAAVVLTFANYVRATGELDPDLEVELAVNQGPPTRARFLPADLGQRGLRVVVPGAALRAGPNTIALRRSGRGALYYAAALRQVVRLAPIPALDEGLEVRRDYLRVERRLDAQGNPTEVELPLTGPVTLGETIRVRLQLRVSRSAGVEHVNIEDRLPAGFEVVRDDAPRHWGFWTPWQSAREVHDDRVVFFATQLDPSGGQVYEYRYDLRPEVAGSFLALPARAEAVYGPETHGRSAAETLVVQPR